MKELDSLVADSLQLQQNILAFKKDFDKRIIAVKNNIDYVDSSSSSTLSWYFDSSMAEMRECSRLLNKMSATEKNILKERFENENFYKDLTSSSIKYLLVIFCIVTLVLFIMLIKELISRIKYQEELQVKLIDLKRSHDELEEIAYVTSHDLQEPLRKIQVFSNMLMTHNNGKTDDEIRNTLDRINSSAKNMQLLITGLMNLSSLTRIDEKKKPTDLNVLIQSIIIDLNDKIIDKKAAIVASNLPMVNGYENQLKILFTALLENSLHFTREGVIPHIAIKGEETYGTELKDFNKLLTGKKFTVVTIQDNGIGFDNQFITKMFRIFQKLHTSPSDYEGKGIGLAICQRIMANHEGYITGNGEPMKGATFKLFFPMDI